MTARLRENWVSRLNLKQTDRHLYSTTGLHKSEILDLCEMIHRGVPMSDRTWPPILGLYKSLVVALTYLRRNRVQEELAETYGVSQSTISRAITAITPLVEKLLRTFVPIL